MNLWTANALAPDPKYLDTITAQVDHLFGRNGYDRSQVTALGYHPPMFPHHRPSIADGITDPWPGLLVGGQQSSTTPDWADSLTVANVNEIAINWNGALVYALASGLKLQQ
jgi:endoglucanase